MAITPRSDNEKFGRSTYLKVVLVKAYWEKVEGGGRWAQEGSVHGQGKICEERMPGKDQEARRGLY